MWDTNLVCQGQRELEGWAHRADEVLVCGVIDPVFMHHIDLIQCVILSILFI